MYVYIFFRAINFCFFLTIFYFLLPILNILNNSLGYYINRKKKKKAI